MLQVHSGTFKGKKLLVPKGTKVRPTTARVKQSIFDSLTDMQGKTVLDCFAGSGALGIESISRGSAECVFIEKDSKVVKLIIKNLQTCGISSNYNIMNLDYKIALNILQRKKMLFDYIFIDPPFELYKWVNIESLIDSFVKILDREGTIIIEHIKAVESYPSELSVTGKKYGSNYVSFVSHNKQESI